MTDTEILKNAFIKIHTGNIPLGTIAIASFPYEKYIANGMYRAYIFQIEFAKAFWGEEPQKVYGGIWNKHSEKPTTIELHEVPVWQYHLQQMVLQEEPLKYLEKFL